MVKRTVIEVVEKATNEVIHTVATDDHRADRVERGLNINLDHAKYRTRQRITPSPPTPRGPK
jgi:hypothetical protein